MKIKFAVIIILFLLVSCWKDIDDTNNNCTNDCTTISGRIVTEDGTVPASELNFQLDWKIQSELGGTYRNIKKFKSYHSGGRIDSKEQLEKVVEAAGNQINYININKFPGDKIVSIKDSIYVPPGDTITYNVN